MKILITGAAGFIGYSVTKLLLSHCHEIVGLDNINDYYDVSLKFDRLEDLGIDKTKASVYGEKVQSSSLPGFSFIRLALENNKGLKSLFSSESFDVVCHLAAQAGVRYSLENPEAYIVSNIVGFLNILECCRHHGITHLVYASSSSVYGENQKIPFETSDRTDHPVSLYAATKKSNELMAYTYSHLYKFPTTGLRFFTVYGPWGRPDMAMFLFTDAILKKKPINVFNHGNLERDFTYIDDICEGVVKVIEGNVDTRQNKEALSKVYNIGNSKSVKLTHFIEAIEEAIGIEGVKDYQPMQPGDVPATWANVDDLIQDYGYRPDTPIEEGVRRFVAWYRKYYKVG